MYHMPEDTPNAGIPVYSVKDVLDLLNNSMKEVQVTKEYVCLGKIFRVTKYFGPNVLKIEQYDGVKWLKDEWRQIYFGHLEPLEVFVQFFKDNPEPKP